jgi:hypothetical protein
VAIQSFLRENLSIDDPLILPNAEAIWLKVANRLEIMPLECGSFGAYENRIIPQIDLILQKDKQETLFDADLLLPRGLPHRLAWEQFLRANAPRNIPVYVDLKNELSLPTRVPSLYHVERAMGEQTMDGTIISQLLRYLMCNSQKDDSTIWINGVNERSIRLIAHLESCIGAPRLVLIPTSFLEIEDILDYAALSHSSDVRIAIDIDAYQEIELQPLLRSFALRYPLGRLILFKREGMMVTYYKTDAAT